MREYFCGWYFKCQSNSQTLAVIPAFHRTSEKRFCSIQLITDGASWNASFPCSHFRKDGASISVAGSRFDAHGMRLDLRAPGISASGSLRFGPLAPIKYDIMGPFRFIPFMECRHSVFSMKHTVTGELDINGVSYCFRDAAGYIEGDRGSSFPREYAWTQCSFPEGSLMLSAADIPLAGRHFTGVIGAILWRGKEYRIATYLGARAAKVEAGEIVVRQGGTRLTATLLEESAHPLRAPVNGAMARTIREHASCRAYYRLEKDGRTLFELEAPNASFEYEYPH